MADLSPYQFETSPLWDDIIARLNDMITSEVSEALTQQIDKDIRGHQCGRADALVDFKHTLVDARQSANPDKNIVFDA
jgi:hypothetical protein